MAEISEEAKAEIDKVFQKRGLGRAMTSMSDSLVKARSSVDGDYEVREIAAFHYLFDRPVENPSSWYLVSAWEAHPHVLGFYLNQEARPEVVEAAFEDLPALYAEVFTGDDDKLDVRAVLESHPHMIRGWSREYELENLSEQVAALGPEEGVANFARALRLTNEVLDNNFFLGLLQLHDIQLDLDPDREVSSGIDTQELLQVVKVAHPHAEDADWILSVLVALGHTSALASVFDSEEGLASGVANRLRDLARELEARHPQKKKSQGPSVWDHIDD